MSNFSRLWAAAARDGGKLWEDVASSARRPWVVGWVELMLLVCRPGFGNGK
jgi:hypothetical protein